MEKIGLIYAIGAALLWGLVYTLDERILAKASPGVLMFASSIIAAMVTLPFLFMERSSIKELLFFDKPLLLLIIFSQILAAIAGFFIFASIKTAGSAFASIIEISYPFFVVLFSMLLLGNQVNIYFWIGGILIFSGAVIISQLA